MLKGIGWLIKKAILIWLMFTFFGGLIQPIISNPFLFAIACLFILSRIVKAVRRYRGSA